ncbi:hypothetical protein [Pseudomonas sp. GXZC]|uniref:hypothetical protein n=1 Tax=Pseudomonas sp. GXZC TaxID=3003351 RepID=UPI0022AADB33|nr:hypothetical protein [Pseudomonas sp. GXZC]WAT32222.1 hypothetical protein OZ428_33630 [Pseudomonas sp. GXZC]
MTENKTIDGVSRLLLRDLLEPHSARCLKSAQDRLRALLDAPAVERADDPVALTTVAVIRERDDEKRLEWLLEGGIAELEPGQYLIVADQKVTDDEGYGELYRHQSERPEPIAVGSLEIVGRECFPSEAMKSTQGYRKEPWVDGEFSQVPSEPGFYRVEPLVRLSDVTRLIAD